MAELIISVLFRNNITMKRRIELKKMEGSKYEKDKGKLKTTIKNYSIATMENYHLSF